MLGWTQEEIADVAGLDQPRIAQILLEFQKSEKLIKSDAKKKSVDEVALLTTPRMRVDTHHNSIGHK